MTGLDLIKKSEGLRLNAYMCPAGIPSIGYGHTKGVKLGQSISAVEADKLLLQDYKEAEQEVKNLVKVPINENQLGALTSFVFNLGASRLMGSTLLRKLNSGDYIGAAREFEKWVFARDPISGVRVVLNGLERRRKAERDLFERKV